MSSSEQGSDTLPLTLDELLRAENTEDRRRMQAAAAASAEARARRLKVREVMQILSAAFMHGDLGDDLALPARFCLRHWGAVCSGGLMVGSVYMYHSVGIAHQSNYTCMNLIYNMRYEVASSDKNNGPLHFRDMLPDNTMAFPLHIT